MSSTAITVREMQKQLSAACTALWEHLSMHKPLGSTSRINDQMKPGKAKEQLCSGAAGHRTLFPTPWEGLFPGIP